jgi:hypothetical protein
MLPRSWGSSAFYEIIKQKLVFRFNEPTKRDWVDNAHSIINIFIFHDKKRLSLKNKTP